ncbi:MAG: apolipoprotein N-acyltransferase [Spirochaetales bacterium]|nr:apolipoprotein N-acyltransferase [Spirochaetales bacterium]
MKLKLLLLTLFSSALMTLAIPNELFYYGSLPLALVALIPLFLALYHCRSIRYASFLGFIFAVTNSFATYFWLLFFQDFSVWTCTGVALGHALYFSLLFPIFSHLLRRGGRYRSVLIAAAWVSYEYLKSIGYIGFPWGLLAYPLENLLPLIQIADSTGPWGISFLAAMTNAALAEFFLPRPGLIFTVDPRFSGGKLFRHLSRAPVGGLLFTAALYVLVLLYGALRLSAEIPYEKTLKVLLVQQNADSWVSGLEMPSIVKGQNLTRQGLEELQPDLVVWSENSFREPYLKRSFQRRPKEDPFVPFLQEIDAPVLVGSPVVLDWEKRQVMNGAILIDPRGDVLQTYGKQHPVPFAEHIPYWDVPAVRHFFTEVVGLQSAGWTLGTEYSIFRLTNASGQEVSFGVPICFEDAFPYLCRGFILQGADLLVNITNDSWSRTVSAETQHYAASMLRAVESRRVLVRSTNAGVTTVVDPFGRRLKTLPFFQEGYLAAEIPVYRDARATVYLLYGDWFAWALILVTVGFLISFLPFLSEKGNTRKRQKKGR